MLSTIRVSLVAAAGLGLMAACVPGQQAHHQTSLHDQVVPIVHRLVLCARQNGMPDLPDPTIDDQGQPHFPNGTPDIPDQAKQACQYIYDQLPAQVRGGTSEPTPDVNQLRKFAQCMRQQGITDWPDPNANGEFPLPPSLEGSMKTGPRWPQIRAAWDGPCKKYNTTGHIKGTGG